MPQPQMPPPSAPALPAELLPPYTELHFEVSSHTRRVHAYGSAHLGSALGLSFRAAELEAEIEAEAEAALDRERRRRARGELEDLLGREIGAHAGDFLPREHATEAEAVRAAAAAFQRAWAAVPARVKPLLAGCPCSVAGLPALVAARQAVLPAAYMLRV